MAGTAEQLTAARAALLLRCQAAREKRQRVAVAQATRVRLEAEAALGAAQASAMQAWQAREDAASRAADAMAGRLVSAATLLAMPAEHARQRAEAAHLAATVEAAAQTHRETVEQELGSRQALTAVLNKLRRRERLADDTAGRYRAVMGLAEEIEREDAVADGWRPAL